MDNLKILFKKNKTKNKIQTDKIICLFFLKIRFRRGFRSVFCCVCFRSETAKQRFKHHQYKKRNQYSEYQPRIRCISNQVSPVSNGKVLRENLLKLNENVNKSTASLKKYPTKHHPTSIHNNHQSSNTDQLTSNNNQTNEFVNRNLKKLVNQLDVCSELDDCNEEHTEIVLLHHLHKPENTRNNSNESIQIDKM